MSPAHWAAAVAVSNGGQRLPGQRRDVPQVLGFGDAPAGFGFGDAQPVRQRRRQCAAEFFFAGLRRELIDQRVLRCPQPTRHPFQTLQAPATAPGW